MQIDTFKKFALCLLAGAIAAIGCQPAPNLAQQPQDAGQDSALAGQDSTSEENTQIEDDDGQSVSNGRVEVGAAAPDFTMTGIDGQEFKLSEHIGRDKNIVLLFSRANW